MKKAFRRILLVLFSVLILVTGFFYYLRYQTKQASPEAVELYEEDGVRMEVHYSRPSKKGRQIFGSLVPYGETWRTGANEVTTFESNIDLLVNGKRLPAGKYSLWTIPNPNEWIVIFNTKNSGWGVDMNGKASRDAQFDMLTVISRPQTTYGIQDTFAIDLSSSNMSLKWDQVKVDVTLDPVFMD
ncbi:MAG: DUF2911 domain-containing protein [Bacteroidetes bacterium]|uniref:DUF2911 domain-containing protein n=1 Tax=Phaeocystidibacter marisrubri TaxID=1577780 RepID=A0A6L3ZHZ1_9FLAO|nr:DUF2911 domain-containing protein [Phaeocystidibacter marisrubri]KAB2817626.1 DUF2911 domain-containing protein [Phaeocystidibacter marisrubri]TNE29936.1 MAG: DUF2911 domain-containing protein [Bacteroidota bacterium]GGH74411.1 hypothetical protein GCM10011318_20370 [Phaeocystidibacter marisrubri]